MRKTLLTVFASALIAATAAQAASASEHHRTHRAVRAQAQVSEPVRNANAFVPAPTNYDSRPAYYNGAYSAPAGR